MNINNYVKGKTFIGNKLVFGGGQPIFCWIPNVVKWGPHVSIFWLGTELVWLRGMK